MVKRTPQEKKELSYEKDRRNTYSENDKASRKAIPANKARVNRSYRRKVNDALHVAPELAEPQIAEAVEHKVASVKRKFWKKAPDTQLGEVVEKQLERRETHAGNGKTARKKEREFLKNLKIEVEQETDGRWIAEAQDMNGVLVYGDTKEEAIISCERLAYAVFIEAIGAGEATVHDDHVSISIQRY
jgi:hypothetical protein